MSNENKAEETSNNQFIYAPGSRQESLLSFGGP